MNYQYLTKGGVDQWNQWRKAHPHRFPNLSGVNLSHHYLFEVDLSGMNLSRADLSRACLIGANLSGANLSDANLMGAYLSQANLSCANLHNANLLGASLKKANLSYADLSKSQSNSQTDAQVKESAQRANFTRIPRRINHAVIDLYSDIYSSDTCSSDISQPLVCFVAAPHFSHSPKASLVACAKQTTC